MWTPWAGMTLTGPQTAVQQKGRSCWWAVMYVMRLIPVFINAAPIAWPLTAVEKGNEFKKEQRFVPVAGDADELLHPYYTVSVWEQMSRFF